MKEPSPYKCDYCGARKGEANHWFLLYGPPRADFQLKPWAYGNGHLEADTPGVQHICSEKCCITALSQYLAKQGKP